jgi:hypothetical protein
MGNAKDSWLEIDFNEYKSRKFLHGKVKAVFDLVGKQMRATRSKKTQSQLD